MDSFLDTFVGDIPKPASQFNPEIPQEGIDLTQYQAPQVEARNTIPVFYLLERTDSAVPTTTVEVTEDFILTHVTIQCSGDPNAGALSRDVYVYIGSSTFLSVNVVTASTVEHFSSVQEIPIPSWLITKDTLFGCYINETADGVVRANVTFVGYKK